MSINTTPHTPAAVRNADGLAVIGRTLHDLRGIRFDNDEGGNAPAGGQGGDQGGNGNGSGQQPAGGQQPGGQQPAGGQQPQRHQQSRSNLPGPVTQPPAGQQGQQGGQGGDGQGQQQQGQQPRTYTPEETEQYVHGVREEARQHREAREAAERERDAAIERQNAILKAAGFQLDDKGNVVPYTATVPTEQAQQQTQQTQAERDSIARENLVLRVAPSLAADADKMLDSRSFASELAKLKADDRAGAEALVKKWVEDHPEHKTTPPPAAASGQTQHSGSGTVTGRKTRQQALAERMKPARS